MTNVEPGLPWIIDTELESAMFRIPLSELRTARTPEHEEDLRQEFKSGQERIVIRCNVVSMYVLLLKRVYFTF